MFAAMPLVWRVVAVLAALAALLGVGLYGVHQVKEDGAASEKTAVAQQATRDIEAARTREQQIQTSQQESDREANRFNTSAAADRSAATAAAAGLLDRVRAADAARVPANPAADAAGSAAGAAPDLCADVLGRVEAAALDIGDFATLDRGAFENAVRQHAAAVTP